MLNSNSLVGLSPSLRALLSDFGVSGLPAIRGTWFIVDPYKVTEGAGGIEGALTNFSDAYTACVSGRGDGILVLAAGATTYSAIIKTPIAWTKWGITVLGIGVGGYNSRARITHNAALTSSVSVAMNAAAQTITRSANSFITDGWEVGMKGIFNSAGTNSDVTFTVTAVSALVLTGTVGSDSILDETATSHTLCAYAPYLIDVSGSNNRFYNVYFVTEANHVLNCGAVSVSGNRNSFSNCHFNTVGALASADATLFDVRVSSSEVQFSHCWFGNNNVLRSSTNGNILLGLSTTQLGQDYFEDCYILSTSATAGHGAVKIANAATLGGWVVFKGCNFINWASGAITALTTAIIGATPNNCGIYLDATCGCVGYADWGANNDKWACAAAANAGTAGDGGLATTTA